VGTGVVHSVMKVSMHREMYQNRFIPDSEPFACVEPLLSEGLGSVVIIVSNHRSMLLRAALLFGSFDGERLFPTRGRMAPDLFRRPVPSEGRATVGPCFRRIWYIFPSKKIRAMVHLVLFIICVLQGIPRQGPIPSNQGRGISSSHSSQVTVLCGSSLLK
jgi:hypothetical protein